MQGSACNELHVTGFSSFGSNTAGGQGGALSTTDCGAVVLANVSLVGNTAAAGGGGAHVANGGAADGGRGGSLALVLAASFERNVAPAAAANETVGSLPVVLYGKGCLWDCYVQQAGGARRGPTVPSTRCRPR